MDKRNPNAGKIFVEDSVTGGWNEQHPDGTTTPADGPFSQGVDPIANLPDLAAKMPTVEEQAEQAERERGNAMLLQLQYVVYLEAYMAGYKEATGIDNPDMAQGEMILGLAQKAWSERVKVMQTVAEDSNASS